MRFVKRFKVYLGIFIPILAFFLMSENISAVSIQTAGFDLSYKAGPNSSYEWANSLVYGQAVNLQEASGYQFLTADLSPAGNYASIHFETNIVANASSQQYLNFKNLDFISINACASSVTGPLNIQASSVSTAVTPWTDSQNRPSKTLTVYGDVALGGLTPNTQQKIFCLIGSSSYALFSTNYTSATANMYFEQNPMTILYTNNQSENLLQSQINQNNTIINQNQQILDSQNQNTGDIINNQTQNTQDIIDNQTQNTEDIIRSNQNCYQSNNLWGGFSNDYSLSDHGVSFVNNTDGSIYAIGTANSAAYSMYAGAASSNGRQQQFEAGTYTLSGGTNSLRAMFIIVGPGTSYITNATSGSVTFTLSETVNGYIRGYVPNGISVNQTINVQLEKGSTASSYEPFGEEICKNYNAEYYDEQRQADQNISNQSSSDIQGSDNQVTTNLIGIISSFFTELSSFSATDCNLSLPLPSFIGGNTSVNICQGKDVLGNFISLFSTLTVVMFYIPLAWILLKMIYNEIRSWTNG